MLGSNVPTGLQGGVVLGASVEIVLTSSQLLNLHTTPIVIVPALGPGQGIMLSAAYLEYVFKGTAYTVNNAKLDFQINGTSLIGDGINMGGFLDKTNSVVNWGNIGLSDNNGALDVQPTVNQPLKVLFSSGNVSDGNGLLNLGIFYNIMNLV